jgi:hypothetical protein
MTTTNDHTRTGVPVYPLSLSKPVYEHDPGEMLQDRIEQDPPLPELAAADLSNLGRALLGLLNQVRDAERMQHPAAEAENAAGNLYQAVYDIAEGAEDPDADAEHAEQFPVMVFDAMPAPLKPYVQLGYVLHTAPEVAPRWMAAVLGQLAELLALAVGITTTTAYADQTGRDTAAQLARVLADAQSAIAGATDINNGAESAKTEGGQQ